MGWMAAAAAAVLVVGSLEVVRFATKKSVARFELAKSAKGVPPELVVLVPENGKLFHVAGCEFIRDKNNLRTMTAAEAERKGYSPCVRCLQKYPGCKRAARAQLVILTLSAAQSKPLQLFLCP